MATLISESNFRPSISPMIDQQFDLDEVLALADEYSTPYDDDHHEITTVSEAPQNPLVVDCMPISTVNVDSNCAVCMENFYSGETGERITCGHVYHASCITAWLSICNSCPLCRSRISGAVQFLCAGE
ncbi:E3 ubiquitin-protein ligase [Morus notabilis]|uniref:E3 ubiquitin-protein ligase n=1 Tax=Morus notabilis TaxID=981085 RepID=W9QZ21_9ROSA|nr:E3 ubiquitin-protein ligase RNF181 [Morus notabilis]EXB59772.1 E3 ubiquitin-protein ligase [Morus notabilis]